MARQLQVHILQITGFFLWSIFDSFTLVSRDKRCWGCCQTKLQKYVSKLASINYIEVAEFWDDASKL